MVRVATSTYTGHIQVGIQGFHAQQKMELWLATNSPPVQWLKQVEQSRGPKDGTATTHDSTTKTLQPWQKRVVAWSPRVFGSGLVSTGSETSGAFLIGLDLVRESRVTRLSETILKAITQEAIRSGRYKDRLPHDYLNNLQPLIATSSRKPTQDATQDASSMHHTRLIHQAIQTLKKDKKRYEQTIQGLLRGKEIAVGRGLARVLEARVGSSLAIVAQPYQGLISDDRYTIAAIVDSGNPDMDMSLAILPIAQLQELLWLQNAYHTLVLHLDTENGHAIRQVALQMEQHLQQHNTSSKTSTPAPSWEVLPWQKVSPELYEFINADEASQYLVTLILFFLVAFIILNTLQMAWMERIREFGILRSLGMPRRQLFALLLWEGIFLAGIAIVVGTLLALPIMLYLQHVGIPLSEPLHMGGILIELQLEGLITPQGLWFPALIVLLTTCVVSLYPAYHASRLKPIDALRHI